MSSRIFKGLDQTVSQCHTCKYSEDDFGNIEGNLNCIDQPVEINDSKQMCPKYAKASCYTGHLLAVTILIIIFL